MLHDTVDWTGGNEHDRRRVLTFIRASAKAHGLSVRIQSQTLCRFRHHSGAHLPYMSPGEALTLMQALNLTAYDHKDGSPVIPVNITACGMAQFCHPCPVCGETHRHGGSTVKDGRIHLRDAHCRGFPGADRYHLQIVRRSNVIPFRRKK